MGCALSIHINIFSDDSDTTHKLFIVSTTDKFIRRAESSFQAYTFNSISLGYMHSDHILIFEADLPNSAAEERFRHKCTQVTLRKGAPTGFDTYGRSISHFGSFSNCLPYVKTLVSYLRGQRVLQGIPTERMKKETPGS